MSQLRTSTKTVLFLEMLAGLVALLAVTVSLFAQTRADSAQIKNFVISPIVSVERFQCVDPSPTTSDCNGLKMIRIVLADGTILGPYVTAQTSVQINSDPRWVRIPLATPDPPTPLTRPVVKKNSP